MGRAAPRRRDPVRVDRDEQTARRAEALLSGLPAAFRTSRFVFDAEPWRSVSYSYPVRPAATVDVSRLPAPMRAELAWWLHSLQMGGERVNSWNVAAWVKLAEAASAQAGVMSFAEWSVSEWLAADRRAYHDRHGRIPPKTFEQNHGPVIRRLHAALSRVYNIGEWWRADVWDPRHDPRIPVREHEALAGHRLSFAEIPQGWLRQAMQWYFAVSLETGTLVWTSLPGMRTYLGTHFSGFLAASGIDDPVLCTKPETELRGIALAFLAYLRQHRSRRDQPLSATSVGLIQSTLSSFYAFMADHRSEATVVLNEPRWAGLTDAHARLWRAGEVVGRARPPDGSDYIDPATLSRIVEHAELLGLPKDQVKVVIVDGTPREIQGFGDPQARRAFLLAVHTGRRINEILLMEPEPLSTVPGMDIEASRAAGGPVARMRYRQSKIPGAPDTILVDQEVVDLISEQQAWLVHHLAYDGSEQPPRPRYLFLAYKANRDGKFPYSANTLRTLLRQLARQVELRDSQGQLVDFQRTHRFRHTRATELLNSGVPLPVVQRYMGHLSPEMTMHYAATLAEVHEAEFLRFAKLGRDGRALGLDPNDVYELVQLDRHTDRVLPNGYCLLPPPKRCERGNACLTCDHFATDARHLPELRSQLAEAEALVDRRRAQHLQRTGTEMGEENVWLRERRAEVCSLQAIVVALEAHEGAASPPAVRGAGVSSRAVPVKLTSSGGRR